MSNDYLRGASSDGVPSYDGRIGGFADRVQPSPKTARRHRDRIPSLTQLESLIKDGVLVLPARYFRGFFLDMIV